MNMEHEVQESWEHGLWPFRLFFRKIPLLSFTWDSRHSELQKVHLPWNLTYLEIPEGLALRVRDLDICLSFNQIGRVGRGAFLVVLLYFFFWPQVTHRITMVQVNISTEGRKRGQQNCFCISKGLCLRQVFILLLIWSVSAHLLCGCTLPGWWPIFALTRLFLSEHRDLVQQKKFVLPTPCWHCFPSIKRFRLSESGGWTSKIIFYG